MQEKKKDKTTKPNSDTKTTASASTAVFDYSDLLEEAKDRIEERIAIYGD